MIELYGLYLLPFALRFALASSYSVWEIVLSLCPIAIVFPSSYTTRFFGRDHEKEHVVRHTFYAVAFTVAAGTSVRWEYILEHLDTCLPLMLYLIVGCVALWWFVISHVVENHCAPWLRTHQGDVAVLPLTLVAIATFARQVPDDAFRFSRSIIFFVPIVVAWATMFFIAYHGFATRRITTFQEDGFDFHARGALVIASAHLSLLECNSPSSLFQFFPLVAAILCQTTSLYSDPPRMRPMWKTSTLVTSLGLGAAGGALLLVHLGWFAFVCTCVLTPLIATVFPTLCGRLWVIPGASFLSLGLIACIVAQDRYPLAVSDILAICALSFLVCWTTQFVCRPVWTPTPPPSEQRSSERTTTRPQETVTCLSPSWWFGIHIPCCIGMQYTSETPAYLLERYPVNPNCPLEFRGVWWMEGNTFPVDLVVVHSADWSRDGKRAVRYDADGITHDASLFGIILLAWTYFKRSRIDVVDDVWIRTCAWYSPLRWLFVTYWIEIVDADRMERVVLDTESRVTWRYTLKRVLSQNGRKTAYFSEYESACRGRRYIHS